MTPGFDPSPWLIIPVAYLAAGTYYIMRDIKTAAIEAWHIGGLLVVGVLWLPISMLNLITLYRTQGVMAAAYGFVIETLPPLMLGACIAIAY